MINQDLREHAINIAVKLRTGENVDRQEYTALIDELVSAGRLWRKTHQVDLKTAQTLASLYPSMYGAAALYEEDKNEVEAAAYKILKTMIHETSEQHDFEIYDTFLTDYDIRIKTVLDETLMSVKKHQDVSLERLTNEIRLASRYWKKAGFINPYILCKLISVYPFLVHKYVCDTKFTEIFHTESVERFQDHIEIALEAN
jgi:hypothetical protein